MNNLNFVVMNSNKLCVSFTRICGSMEKFNYSSYENISLKKKQNKEKSEMEFNVLRSLYYNPGFTQRKLSSHLGVSLGSVNYCINALIDKGLVKVSHFNKSSSKQKYLYLLTPEGVFEKSRLTFSFLEKKHAEYLRLQNEIESLKSELMDNKFVSDK